MQPEIVFVNLKKSIKKEWILCICAVFFVGLLAHFYKFVNFIPNWDSLLNLYTDQNKTQLGRCFLQAACSIGSYYDLPWINGLLSLVYIAGSAICVTEIFQIHKPIPLVLISGLLAAFPTVTSTFAYHYTADGYFLALLCASAAVLIVIRFRYGVFLSAALFSFSLGVYQAYITFAMVLMLLYLIDQLLFGRISIKAFWETTFRFGSCGILGVVLYGTSMKALLFFSRTELSDYQQISGAFDLSRLDLLHSVKRALYCFATYFFDFSNGINLFVILNICMIGLLVCFFLMAFMKAQIWRDPCRLLLILFCGMMIPFASFALYFASPDLDYHNLMRMCLCLIYILPVLFYERLTDTSSKLFLVKQWAILLLTVLTVFNFVLLANICYQKMHMAYEKSYSVIVRLADRIEQLPQADKCEKIAVFGCLPGSESISVNFPPDMTGITDHYIIRKQDAGMQENVVQAMLRDYCGLSFEDTTKEELELLLADPEYQEMGYWPEQDGISVIGNTLVIQFKEEIP